MNSTFLAIAIPAFGAIIGFTYVHEKTMRKILYICTITGLVTSYIVSFCWEFRNEAYYNSLIASIDYPDTAQKYMSLKDLHKSLSDSVPEAEKLFRLQYELYYSGQTTNKIQALMKKDREDAANWRKHIIAVEIAFILCVGLSYLFDYIKKEYLKQGNNKNPKPNP